MASLFRRKTEEPAAPPPVVEEESTAARPKGYTPSKKELGVVTPKRTSNQRRVVEPAPQNRREA